MSSYTDTELHEIAIWLKDGLSASKIATRLSALRGSPVSRNAIIGIVDRNPALKTIGFANPKGGRSGGRPRKNARPAQAGKSRKQIGPSKQTPRHESPEASARLARLQTKPTGQAKLLPSAWLPPRLFLGEPGAVPEALKPPAPRLLVVRRQPHVAAMRFIDCLFGRCRAPLDLTLEEDPENDAPGSRPGSDMLCCGLRTRALKSYCAYHQARFCRPVAEAV